MCLNICEEATAKFFEERKRRTFVKVIKYLDFIAGIDYVEELGNLRKTAIATKVKCETPYQHYPIKAGWLKPETPFKFLKETKTIHGGVIHAYLSSRLLPPDWQEPKIFQISSCVWRIYPINCWAFMEDVIILGNREDIALKRLYIPQKELDRCTKDLCETIMKQCSSSKDSI